MSTDKARETIAALVRPAAWATNCEGNMREMYESERLHSLDNADAILAKLPKIIKGMVQPLGSGPVEPGSDDEWKLEYMAFSAANSEDVPDWAREVVKALWAEVCERDQVLKVLGMKEGKNAPFKIPSRHSENESRGPTDGTLIGIEEGE